MRIKLTYTLSAVAFLIMAHASAQQTVQITPSGIGYLQYLPQGYNSNTNKYPIVISLHGIKEKGTSSTDPALVKAGVPKVANVGLPKYVKYGQQYPFILISPQLKSSYGGWTGDYVMEVLNYVKTKLRVDPKRIYLTGLSLGGFGVWKTAVAYPEVFAAILPICSGGNAVSQAGNIAKENLPTWAFHGDKDYTVSYQVSVKMVNAINASTPKPSPLAKITLFPGMGHVIWDKVYKETSALTWLQSFTNGSVTSGAETPTGNVAPVVSAGSDKTITLPTNTVNLSGSASDSDGPISSYLWTKIAGGTASLSGTTSSTLKASNLIAGTYTFRLTVKDNDGTSKYDDVKVTVNSTVVSGNVPPVANAGSDKTVSTYATKVYGSGSDVDGIVRYYKWRKVSGPGCYMYGVSKPTLELSKMAKGIYYFDLVVTDDKGAVDKDQVKIVIGG